MGKGLQGAVLRAMRVEEHLATVVETRWIAEHIIELTFHSETLLNPDGELPSTWVRMWFPDRENPHKLHQRAYTLLSSDASTGVFSIAVVIHTPSGPASTWAAQATPGDQISVQRYGSSGFETPETPPNGYLLVGDAASWPAIHGIIAALPCGSPIEVVMEQHHNADRALPFPDHPDVNVHWVPTRGDSRALVDALQHRDFHHWRCWVAAESKATRLVKNHLELTFGHNRSTLHSQAYWIQGRAMGKQIEVEETGASAAHTRDTTAQPANAVGAAESQSVLRPARTALILSGIIQALLSISYVVPFVLFAELARRLIAGAGASELTTLGMIGLAVLGINTAGTTILLFAQHVYDAHYSAALRRRLLRKMSRLPLGWFKDRRSAEVKNLIHDNVDSLHYLITHAVPDLVSAVITPLAILIYLFTVDVRLALVLLVPIALYLFITFRQATKDKAKIATVLQWNATLGGDAERFISGQPVSRIFGDNATVNLPRQLRNMGSFLIDWQRSTLSTKLNSLELMKPLSIITLLALAGSVFVAWGIMPATHLIPFLILGPSFGDRLLAVSYAANGLREGLSAKNGLDLLLTTPELANSNDASEAAEEGASISKAEGNIRVRNLSFSYGAGRKVLKDIDLDIPAGSTTALVGPSGSGKSTFAALIARLWDPDSGAISLDGVDLRAMSEEELHRKVAIVLQDVQLIRGTLFDNIALGHPEASMDDVRAAAKAAYIDEFIMTLPDAYDTPVTRNSLSGGQRQRIAIARALLGNPQVVVLDEATAAADPDSEWAVRKGLNALLEGRTKIIVAHRLHTITEADRIVVINHGDVTEQGTHHELINAGGVYSDLTSDAQLGALS